MRAAAATREDASGPPGNGWQPPTGGINCGLSPASHGQSGLNGGCGLSARARGFCRQPASGPASASSAIQVAGSCSPILTPCCELRALLGDLRGGRALLGPGRVLVGPYDVEATASSRSTPPQRRHPATRSPGSQPASPDWYVPSVTSGNAASAPSSPAWTAAAHHTPETPRGWQQRPHSHPELIRALTRPQHHRQPETRSSLKLPSCHLLMLHDLIE